MTETDPIKLIEQDQALKAREMVKDLPMDDPMRQQVESLMEHASSPDAHQEYYRTMRGGICPEDQVFRRHEQVQRFGKIRELILQRQHKTVLDLGCLDGWQLLNLAASGITGVGVDVCSEAIAVARERAKKWGFPVVFIESRIEDVNIYQKPTGIPLNEVQEVSPCDRKLFDAVIISEVLEHVLDPLECLRIAIRHLAKDGILYVSVPATMIPHHGKLEDAREHLRVFSEQDLIDLAERAGLCQVVDHDIIEQEDQGQRFANRTISFRRATITIYTGHVTGGWNPADSKTLGGSEEMVVHTAETWAKQGHVVQVHGDVPTGQVEGVQYHSRARVPDPNPDVMICFKTLEQANHPAGSTIFWTTDLPAPGMAATFLPPKLVDTFNAVVCISEYHRQELLKAVPWLNPAKTHQHWLGVDQVELDCAVQDFEKVDYRVLYASSYDRGLRQLLEAWPSVKAAVPDAELHVTYGWDFWVKSEAVVAQPIAESMRQERKALEELMKQPGVTHLGRLTRPQVLREFAQADVWAYPCTGGELCCKTALEAQATKCKVLVVPTMALAETAEHGWYTTFDRFAKDLIEILQDNDKPTYPYPPTWKSLASWLWELAKPKDRSMGLPVESSVPAEALPEQFPIPTCASAPPARELSILMAVGGMPFDGETDRKRDLGGSETAALQLSRALAKRGHSVSVFSNLPDKPGKFDGVSYIPIDQYARYASSTPHDISIVQREPSGFNMALQSKLNVLWCHDLGLKRYHVPFRSSLWNVDYVVPVSHWHGRQLCEVYDLPAELIAPMNNGIEYEMIRKTVDKRGPRDPNALVYSSRPERGLDLLLQSIFPKLLERNPKLVLYVAAYSNMTEEMRPFYEHCKQLMANLGPSAKWLGSLTKPELYKLYSRASAYVYPSRNFKEVSCISLLEAAACGLPFIGTTLGALPETASRLPGAIQLIEHPGNEATVEFVDRFVDSAWEILSNPARLMAMSIAGATEAEFCSWDRIAKEWERFLLGAIDLRSKDKLRLARHWWKLGDIRGVEQVLPTLSPEEDSAFRHRAETERMVDDTPSEAPVQQVINAICNIAASFKPKTIKGIGPHGDSIAESVAQMIGAQVVSDQNANFVIGVETLDCSLDPSVHIKQAAVQTSPGGHVCLVTASPGVQQDRLHRGYPRARRWVFDNHDLKELFKGQADLLAMVIEGGALSKYDGRPLVWQLHCFRRSDAPVGKVDVNRRLWLQSPQLSLTGAMIVKNGEGLLTRCLKSITPYCDEILIDDTGSTDTSPDIARRFGVEPRQGISPLDVGFDAARNKGLERATGDLVLWIDADEELLDAKALPKYLRWSLYNGFAIQQHHFSAVPANAFKPDLPVRVFRRTWLTGKPTGIRFIGKIHEHPEIGLNQSVGQSIVLSDVHIAHDGYLTESKRRGRFNRNIGLMFRDRAAYPDRVLGKFLMLRDWIHLARYEAEGHGGALTPAAVQYLEAAIEGYRKDFLGGTHQMAVDGLQYYNEALQILRRGFEVQVVLRIGGFDGQPRELTYSGRVLNEEDLQKMLSNSVRDLASVWQGEYL